LSNHLITELKHALLYASMDALIHPYSTHHTEPEITAKYKELIKDAQSIPGSNSDDLICVIAPMMHGIAGRKFMNFHGQKHARWSRTRLLYGKAENTSRLMIFLSPMLFYTPHMQLESLRDVLVEGFVFALPWRRYIQELHSDWRDLTLIATVLLATNVGFLAVPSIDNDKTVASRSPAQILSYLSVILSLSCMFLGQVLARYNRVKGWDTLDGDRIRKSLKNLINTSHEEFAIIYSLPYGFLS